MNINQIYKQSDTKLTFSDWIALHRAQWLTLRKQFPGLPFDQFLQMKLEKGQLNADAENGWLDDIINITKQTYDKYKGKNDPQSSNGEIRTGTKGPEPGNSILGMQPIVAYSLAGVIVLTIGTVIYLKSQKTQNK